jgi:tetratricopeptide (TPR) repeat protein
VSDNDSSDWLWSFITGVLIALSFKLVWWVIKMTFRLLVWLGKAMVALVRHMGIRRQMKTLEEADALVAVGRAGEALPIVQSVLDSGNRAMLPWAYHSLGFAYEGSQRWDEAIVAYDRAISFEDPQVVPLATLGKADALYLGKEDRTAAATIYRQLVVPEDQSFADYGICVDLSRRAMEALASLLYEGGQLTEADQFCERAARGGGFDAVRMAVGRARIAAKQGRVHDAMRIADGLHESDVARLAGLRYPLTRVDSFAAFKEEFQGGSRELAAR